MREYCASVRQRNQKKMRIEREVAEEPIQIEKVKNKKGVAESILFEYGLCQA